MPTNAAPTTSHRLLTLLSLLQTQRDWPGHVLADRLGITERTVRRDVDRLREVGYRVTSTRGTDGGYRLDPGAAMPPLLFDDDQVLALSVALQTVPASGAGLAESAQRALVTIRQVMPGRLRARLDALDLTTVTAAADVDPSVLLAVGEAIRRREELRFDYGPGTEPHAESRQVQPHHLIARRGRWYLLGWSRERDDWRTYRVDRIRPRVPTGPRFELRPVPGGDVGAFVESRFRGGGLTWPCVGHAVLDLPAAEVAPFVGEGTVEPLDGNRCRVELGAWSWPAVAAALLRFDAELSDVEPAELRDAFAAIVRRLSRG